MIATNQIEFDKAMARSIIQKLFSQSLITEKEAKKLTRNVVKDLERRLCYLHG